MHIAIESIASTNTYDDGNTQIELTAIEILLVFEFLRKKSFVVTIQALLLSSPANRPGGYFDVPVLTTDGGHHLANLLGIPSEASQPRSVRSRCERVRPPSTLLFVFLYP